MGAVCVIAVLLPFVRKASAIYAYLPMTGAPEIRMQEVMTNSFSYMAFSQSYAALQAKTAEALSNATELATAARNTNNSSGSAAISASAGANSNSKTGAGTGAGSGGAGASTYLSTSPEAMTDDEKNNRQPANFAFPSSTASDLLTVTPQMLTQYLRPDSNETNHLDRPGVVVFVPADMPFMPPTPKAAPESRAIYQSR